jgi:glycosyltransferase involved in cell wall biosynthesis
VATDVEGVREALGDRADAQIVSPHDPGRFADRVARLLDDRDLAANLGGENQRRVSQEFSFRAMVGAYETLYRGLLENLRER